MRLSSKSEGQSTFITVALRRADGEVIIHPSRATYLALGDSIILMGHQGDMPNFAQQNAFRWSLDKNIPIVGWAKLACPSARMPNDGQRASPVPILRTGATLFWKCP